MSWKDESDRIIRGPITFLAALTIILVIGALACWVPARRAVRVEPMVALRHE